MKYISTIGEKTYVIEVNDDQHVTVDGKTYEIDFLSVGIQPIYSLLIAGRSYEAHVELTNEAWQVLHAGNLYEVIVMDERAQRLAQAGGGTLVHSGEFSLKAPMPGLVVSSPVDVGREVEKGDILVILESMKMQNELKSPRAGTVASVRIKDGDSVDQNQILVVLN